MLVFLVGFSHMIGIGLYRTLWCCSASTQLLNIRNGLAKIGLAVTMMGLPGWGYHDRVTNYHDGVHQDGVTTMGLPWWGSPGWGSPGWGYHDGVTMMGFTRMGLPRWGYHDGVTMMGFTRMGLAWWPLMGLEVTMMGLAVTMTRMGYQMGSPWWGYQDRVSSYHDGVTIMDATCFEIGGERKKIDQLSYSNQDSLDIQQTMVG